ncbi:aldo/keto reductase [Reichenbachiella versicolor]|uniref:aldo/keto reductase n=1 Tax=Reichenbachiella versicolor TaxID=1821036 RepID=UPI000D6DEAF7|nr:aldo/keto reductase [Reichenbachiella versicolor]
MRTLTFDNGDQMPILGLGTWKSAPGEVYEAVLEAIKIGYRHIDCAYIYGNENEVGDAIQEAIKTGLVAREDLWITSKLWNSFHKKEDVEEGMNRSLKALKLDYLDLYLIHWPVAMKSRIDLPSSGADFISLEEIPLIETWNELIELKKTGKIKHIGVSNFSKSKIEEITKLSGIKPEMNQFERHAYNQQPELVDYCLSEGIKVTCYSPLGSADRPARVKRDDEPALLQNEKVKAIAETNGISVAQALIAWTIAKGLVVIPKSTNPERLKQNLDSKDITLSTEDIATIDSLDLGHRYIDGQFWAQEGSPYTVESIWS